MLIGKSGQHQAKDQETYNVTHRHRNIVLKLRTEIIKSNKL